VKALMISGLKLPSRNDVDMAIAELEITDRLEQDLVRFYWNEERRRRRAEIWHQVRYALVWAAVIFGSIGAGELLGRLVK
jgi:hypothetical protein